jgi:hypothetical protein
MSRAPGERLRADQTPATHTELVSGLYKLGVAGLPPVNSENMDQSWTSPADQLAVLKMIEVLTSRRKRIIAEAAHRSASRVEPLSCRTRSQQMLHDQLVRQSSELDTSIAAAQEQLRTQKCRRSEQRQSHANELKELDRKIAQFSEPRK